MQPIRQTEGSWYQSASSADRCSSRLASQEHSSHADGVLAVGTERRKTGWVIKSSRRPTKRSGPAATSYQETGVMGCRKSESREGKLARRERSELQRYDSGSGEVPSQRRSDSRVKSGHPCPRGILRCLRNSAQNPLKNLAWVANLATIRVSWSASAVTGSAFLRRYDIHTDTARWQIGGVGREGARVDKRTGGCQK